MIGNMKIAIVTGGTTGERLASIDSAKNIVEHIDFGVTGTYVFPEQEPLFFEEIENYDLIIPVIHGAGGEDGHLQKKLELLDTPYLFSDSIAHKKSFNKKECKDILSQYNISSPETLTKDAINRKDLPLICKQVDGGSSINVEFINSIEEFEQLPSSDNHILEQFIQGKEFTVGVVEDIDGEI